MKWIWEDYDEMGRHYKCSKCGYKIMVHERMGGNGFHQNVLSVKKLEIWRINNG